jgi:hypothetical protein
MGTIITLLVLTGIVAAIILKIHRDRKNNKCAGCSCGAGELCSQAGDNCNDTARIDSNISNPIK